MLMEWNACPSFQWDWEHLFMLNPKSTESSKLQPTDWFGEVDRDINAGSFYLSWGGAGSGSDHVHSSKSSKSLSFNSSSIDESKTSKLTFQGTQEDSSGKEDVSKNEPNESSRAIEPSGEPLLSLKLGKRLYFEDVCPENDLKSTSISVIPISTSSAAKKCGSIIRSNQPPCCQVEGCNLDLSSAKGYHRKHRVCESHSKTSKVVVCGLERRFCQQCSRFHDLSEFDEKKRSCRKRLSGHNARRRKPHNEVMRFRSSLCSTAYAAGNRQQQNPLAYSDSYTSLIWQDTYSKHVQAQPKEFFMKSENRVPTSGQSQFSATDPNGNPKFSDGLCGMLPIKVTTAKTAINQGESVTSNDPSASQTFHRALSLLSTNSRRTALSGVTLPSLQSKAHVSRTHSVEYWLNEQSLIGSDMFILNSGSESSRFQDFQLK